MTRSEQKLLDARGVRVKHQKSWARYDIWDPYMASRHKFNGWRVINTKNGQVVKMCPKEAEAQKIASQSKKFIIERYIVE